jgi:4-amino-4-deoxy-L-arabinose transferase-like glycosyltransferase
MMPESPPLKIEIRGEYALPAIIFLLAAVLLFSNLWIGDLGLDSAAYATISRAVLRTHDWLVPHYEHCAEFQDCWLHPPLFYWMTAASFKVFGVTEFAARFVSALLGLGTILLVYAIGARAAGSRKAGFLAAFVLLSTQPFLELGRKCQIDVPLAFFLTLAVYFFLRAVGGKKIFFLAAGAAAGLATLTKGLPALGILGVVGLYFLFRGDFKFFVSFRLLLLACGFLLALGLWIVPLALAGRFDEFVRAYFGGQIWGVLTGGAGAAGARPGLFAGGLKDYLWYVGALAQRYWPWLPFLALSIPLALKKRKERPFGAVFLLWGLVFLLFFSAATLKFFRYMAPLYPAFALLIGTTLGDRLSDASFRKFVNASAALLGILLLAVALFPLYFGRINAPDKTEIKAMAPYIRLLVGPAETVAVHGLNYWTTVADFAFYVDRPVRALDADGDFLAALRDGERYGYLTRAAYESLAPDVRASLPPLIRTKSFVLVTNAGNRDEQLKRIVPFPLF